MKVRETFCNIKCKDGRKYDEDGTFIDSLTEEPVNDDMEEAIQIEGDVIFHKKDYVISNCGNWFDGFNDGFKAGAKWQKDRAQKESVT